jgi:hypothetical protein
VPECIGAGLVDMSTGMLLAADTLDEHPHEVLDLIAAATFDLFQGRNVVMIEEIFKARYGVLDDRHYFQEFLAQSDSHVHVFLRSSNQDIAAVVIVFAAEGHRRLAAPVGQFLQPAAAPAGEHHRIRVARQAAEDAAADLALPCAGYVLSSGHAPPAPILRPARAP